MQNLEIYTILSGNGSNADFSSEKTKIMQQ